MSLESLVKTLSPCLRGINEEKRVFPTGKRIEIVFLVETGNYLLLRTEGVGHIDMIRLPEKDIEVPVILPEKLQAVTRRRMLEFLRQYAWGNPDKMKAYIEEAKKLGFEYANIHLEEGWNCTIQPPIASSGEKATDSGMDGYCPACILFGVAMTSQQLNIGKKLSIGVKSRVHFDPAFATRDGIVPATHNKVAEGLVPTTGQSLYREIHIEPGTVFVGRVVLTDVTEPELLTFLQSLLTVEHIGGRAGIYGTVKIHLVSIRCGDYSTTTALELAEAVASKEKQSLKQIKEKLEKLLKEKGFITNMEEIEEAILKINPRESNGIYKKLWDSAIAFDKQVVSRVKELKESNSKKKSKGKNKE